MSGELALGDVPPPSWRSQVENALYLEAKWVPDQINYFMDQLRKEHAHELAEKVRSSRLEAPEGFVHRQAWIAAWNEGRDDSADLIDPEEYK